MDLIDTYGHGQCASLAMAVLEHMKLACVVFYKTDPDDDSAAHVANEVGTGFLDIYGIVSHADLEARYGCQLRAAVDPHGEDTAVQFEVCMGEWADEGDELDPYGAKRAWRDCATVMMGHIRNATVEATKMPEPEGQKPAVVYHASAPSNRQSIARLGLIGSDATSPGGSPVVFVSDTFNSQEGMDVYAIDASGLVLEEDSTTEPPAGERWFAFYGDIAPSAVQLIVPCEQLDEALHARVAALPRLQQHAGAAYTLHQVAAKVLQGASGDAMAVDWAQVHQDVFAKAVGQDRQPVATVLEAIKLHSPGAVTPQQLAAIDAMGESAKVPVAGSAIMAMPSAERATPQSYLVGAKGKPLVLYHGTAEVFDTFNKDFVGLRHADIMRESGDHDDVDPSAFYFTACKETALWYAKDAAKQLGKPEEEGVVMTVILSMEKPKTVQFGGAGREYLAEEIEGAKSSGCDGLICRNFDDGGVSDHFIVFEAGKVNILETQTCREFESSADQVEVLGKARAAVKKAVVQLDKKRMQDHDGPSI